MRGRKSNEKQSAIFSLLISIVIVTIGFCGIGWTKTETFDFNSYHNPTAVQDGLKQLAETHPAFIRLHKIATTPGQNQINLLEIGPEVTKTTKTRPAILVVANMEGTLPITTEAALYLAQTLVNQPTHHQDITWYILPLGNPDAAWNFFKKPLKIDNRNLHPYNDDMDDRSDEDGPDDLDNNGIITTMRVKDPEGEWIPVPGEPRLMKEADWTKGEKGIFKLYSEGIDNDNDGQYNEDGPGGVNLAVNFPHLFKFFTPSGGPWAGSETETYNLFKFVYNHPEIAMTIYFGDTNFCMTPPEGGRKGTADYSNIKIPKRIAEMIGFDPNQSYTMDEIMEKAKDIAPPGMELTENIVASFLGLGAAVNPQPDDLEFYTEISGQYKKFLEKQKLNARRAEPKSARDGSFELWAYYHLGIPSFSLDFWTLPLPEKEKDDQAITPEKLEAMTNEQFLALGEEKIDAFLKSSGAPANINAKMVIDMVKSGVMNTKKMATMMKQMPQPKNEEGSDPIEKATLLFGEKHLDGHNFIPWKTFNHPTLGEIEIGGFTPYSTTTPPATMLEILLKGQVPWVFELANKIPKIKLVKTRVTPLGNGLFRISAWVENSSYLPYPTSMGQRNERLQPIVLSLQGNAKILEGKKRQTIKSLAGLQAKPIHWVVMAPQPVALTVEARTQNAGNDSATISLSKGDSQ